MDGWLVTWRLAGAKLVSLSSHSVAIIPLESLEGMLQLCEDALGPLEGGRWVDFRVDMCRWAILKVSCHW